MKVDCKIERQNRASQKRTDKEGYLLVNDKTGAITSTKGFPKAAVDHEHIACLNPDWGDKGNFRGIQLLGYVNNELAVIFEEELEELEDIKSSFNVTTYYKVNDLEMTYYGQGQVYMWLLGFKVFRVHYCLVDTPEYIIDEIKKKFESNIGAFTPQQKERTKSKVNNLQANMKETHEELSLFCKEDQPAIKACVDTEQFVTVLLNRHTFDNRISDPVVRVLDFRARNKYLNDNRLRLQQSGDKGQLVVVQVIDGDYYQSSLSHQQKDHLKAEKGSMHLIENCLFVAGMKSETGKLVQEIVSKTAKRLW